MKNAIPSAIIVSIVCACLTGCVGSVRLDDHDQNLLRQARAVQDSTGDIDVLPVRVRSWSAIRGMYVVRRIELNAHVYDESSLATALIEVTSHLVADALLGDDDRKGLVYLKEYAHSERHILCPLLYEYGHQPVDDERRSFIVDGLYILEGPGPRVVPYTVWGVIMGVPSVFLPIPLFHDFEYTIRFTISDSRSGSILAKREEKVIYRGTGFSLWGLLGAIAEAPDKVNVAAAFLINEALCDLAPLDESDKVKVVSPE